MILSVMEAKETLALDDDLANDSKVAGCLESIEEYMKACTEWEIWQLEQSAVAKEAARMLLLLWFDDPLGMSKPGSVKYGITNLLTQIQYTTPPKRRKKAII